MIIEQWYLSIIIIVTVSCQKEFQPVQPTTTIHRHFFSDSQSRLIGIAGEVGSADSDAPVPHPIPPPRRSSSESMERSAGIMGQFTSSSSPPRLPPKNAKLPAAKPPTPTTTPKQQQQQQETSSTQKYEIITQSCLECCHSIFESHVTLTFFPSHLCF